MNRRPIRRINLGLRIAASIFLVLNPLDLDWMHQACLGAIEQQVLCGHVAPWPLVLFDGVWNHQELLFHYVDILRL